MIGMSHNTLILFQRNLKEQILGCTIDLLSFFSLKWLQYLSGIEERGGGAAESASPQELQDMFVETHYRNLSLVWFGFILFFFLFFVFSFFRALTVLPLLCFDTVARK